MIRGFYTSQSSMSSRLKEMNIVSNNLANLSTNGYKKDGVIYKAFPEKLLRMINGKGVVKVPGGSYDLAPFIGKLGTGVSINQVHKNFNQGNLRNTQNKFDLSIVGNGFFVVQTKNGERYTRDGSFLLDRESYLVTKDGDRIQGNKGDIRIKDNNFKILEDGQILVNTRYDKDNLSEFVDNDSNKWENEIVIDKIKVVDFYDRSAIVKEGNNLYVATEFSGVPETSSENKGIGFIKQGFLEMSNVNPVLEMTSMIEVQRMYEASQKSLSLQDALVEKVIDYVLKV